MDCPNCDKEIFPHFDYLDTCTTTKNGRNAIYEDWVAKCPECGCEIRYREWYIHEDDEYWSE